MCKQSRVNLWLESPTRHPHEKTAASSMSQPVIAILGKPQARQSTETTNGQRTLQDLLFAEGLLAARLSVHLDSLEVTAKPIGISPAPE